MNSVSTTNISDHDFDRPSGTGPLYIVAQALRAWLLSACPSGTKAIRPSKGLALSALECDGRGEARIRDTERID
jgi:hypothetical protein